MNDAEVMRCIRDAKEEAEREHRDPWTGIPIDQYGYELLEKNN